MKKLLFFLLVAISSATAQFNQNFFIIGCNNDPFLAGPDSSGSTGPDEDRLQKVINANFNLLSGATIAGRTQDFNGPMGTQFPWQGDNYRPVNNSYVLELIASVNSRPRNATKQLYTMIVEWNNLVCNQTNYCPDHNTMNAAIQRYVNLGNRLNQFIYGYNLIDEPSIGFSPTVRTTYRDLQGILGTQKTAYVNLFGCYVTVVEQDYINFIQSWIHDPSVSVTSFDYYPFCCLTCGLGSGCTGPQLGAPCQCTSNGYTLGYYSQQGYYVPAYIRNFELFAIEIKNQRQPPINHRVNLWGFGASIHHRGGTEIILPHIQHLRYQASAAVCYGAKGMLWFTYEQVFDDRLNTLPGQGSYDLLDPTGAPNSNGESLYNDISAVNAELAAMGPTLMQLDWEATIHGASPDPISGEPNLVTISASTPVLAQFALDVQVAIGIHTHRGTNNSYLTIWNKNITIAKYNVQVVVKGYWEPKVFSTLNSTFSIPCQNVLRANNLTTSFEVPSLQPGGMALVFLDPSYPIRINNANKGMMLIPKSISK